MDEKLKERRKEREFGDDCYVHMGLFTAGIVAVLMACFKRALMVFLLLQEWRAWVFLFLNLVLLAIVFTSTLSTTKEAKELNNNNNNVEVSKNDVESKNKKIITKRHISSKSAVEYCHKNIINSKRLTLLTRNEVGDDNIDDDERVSCREDDDQKESPRLSKEELNERAEAFIVMFRQHLVLDARRSGKH